MTIGDFQVNSSEELKINAKRVIKQNMQCLCIFMTIVVYL